MAVPGTELTHRRIDAAVDVFDLFGGRLGASKTGIDGDEALGVNLAAQVKEFVKSHVVMLDAFPGRILARRPAVGIANAVFPVVAADEVAARPPINRRVKLLEQGDSIGSPAKDVIRRHERDSTDQKVSFTLTDDFDPAVIRRAPGRKGQWKFGV